MNLEKHIDEIERDGFTIVPGVVRDPSELAELQAAVDQAIKDDAKDYMGLPGKHEFIVLDLVMRGIPFVRLLEN